LNKPYHFGEGMISVKLLVFSVAIKRVMLFLALISSSSYLDLQHSKSFFSLNVLLPFLTKPFEWATANCSCKHGSDFLDESKCRFKTAK